jgi:hypothetical protein
MTGKLFPSSAAENNRYPTRVEVLGTFRCLVLITQKPEIEEIGVTIFANAHVRVSMPGH